MFRDLSKEQVIAIDTETYDPGLKEKGPGWAWGEGYILGVSISTPNWKQYYSCSHNSGNNCDPKDLFAWLKKELANPDLNVVFANAPYDIGWLQYHDVRVRAIPHDVIVMAALLDEHRFKYGLDELGRDYLDISKDSSGLIEYAGRVGLPQNIDKLMPRLREIPGDVVAPYAKQDAELTRLLFDRLMMGVCTDGIQKVYNLERRLIPMIVDMRMRGVPVDIEAAEKLDITLTKKIKEANAKVTWMAGKDVNTNSSKQLAPIMDRLGLVYPSAPQGGPSITKTWLESQDHALCKAILETRRYEKIQGTFVQNAILGNAKKGRIHSQFHATKRDEGGTVSGRGSSSNPNLQQVPARDPIMGPLMRGLFLPEDGDKWGSFDYSQQEPRLTVHYSHLCQLPGAKSAVEYYTHHEKPDYHQMVADMANIERPQAKTINLGLAYGMGVAKLAIELGLGEQAARRIIKQYHDNVPFIKGLTDSCDRQAQNTGEIKTIYGRKCRFPLWEASSTWQQRSDMKAAGRTMLSCSHTEALSRINDVTYDDWYGRSIKRAFTFRAMNRLIQGSAADQTKLAMAECYEAGFLPTIQIHDELTFTLPDEKVCPEIKEIMEHCIELSLPTVVDVDLGATWGEAKYGKVADAF